jgi:hypothetical protein
MVGRSEEFCCLRLASCIALTVLEAILLHCTSTVVTSDAGSTEACPSAVSLKLNTHVNKILPVLVRPVQPSMAVMCDVSGMVDVLCPILLVVITYVRH